MGGGFTYTNTVLGLSLEAQTRYLVVHEESELQEWGASLTVRLDSGAAGRGASLTVAPVWGEASSEMDRLWGDADVLEDFGGGTGGGARAAGWTPQRLDVDLGYGLPVSWRRGTFTPYVALSLAGEDGHRYRLGGRLTNPAASAFSLSLEGERRESPTAAPDHGIVLRVRARW